MEEEFEDTKGVIRIRKSKKSREHNGREQAEYDCVTNGGHLVSISSKEEMEFVHGLIIYRIQHILMTDVMFIGMLVKPAHHIYILIQTQLSNSRFIQILH
jgi:hypothetical protein